ncbi:CRE-RNH-1.1 protein [Aphelenchoides avenae]|nr:CRE-RNH-1.1 protein [Aphelenchus avenae]
MATFGGRVHVPMDTSDGNIYVYTDASAPVRKEYAGIGVYFGSGHALNGFLQLKAGIKSGEAEVFAATEALDVLWNWPGYKGEFVVLRSDCLATIEKMEKIIERGTVQEPEQDKTFDNAVRLLIQLAEKFPKGVRFEHVYAGSDDEGIQAADRLATRASHGLTALKRGHNHNRSRKVATREQRNFFHPASFRFGKKFHVPHNPYDECIALLQCFALTDTTTTKEEMRDPGYESGDEDLDSSDAKGDETEDEPPAKKPRTIGATKMEISDIDAQRLQDVWGAAIRSSSMPTRPLVSPGNRDNQINSISLRHAIRQTNKAKLNFLNRSNPSVNETLRMSAFVRKFER